MGIFSDFKHASFAKESYAVGTPKTVATAQSDGTDAYKRVKRSDLEMLYLTDPQTFNTINIYKQMMLQAGYKITAINKTNQKQYDEFFQQMGKVGMQIGLEQLMDRIIHDSTLYGYAYVEKVLERNGKIVDLKPVDAKLMDYARNNDNMILINSSQNPVGYTMTVGYGVKAKGDQLPNGIKMNSHQIFISAERIACFILFPYGNGFESLGVIEASYKATERKHKIEDAISNVIYNTAAYPIYAIVGDGNQKASKQVMESTLSALQNFSYNRFGVFPHPTQLNTLQVEHSPQATELLGYLRSEQSASSGLATGFTIGSGEAINRSTLNTQKEMVDVRLDSVSWSIAEQFTKKILNPLKERNKYGSYAIMEWNEISTEDKVDKAKVLMDAIDKGIIAPVEAREYILRSNEIKPLDNEYKKLNKEKKEAKENSEKVSKIDDIKKERDLEDYRDDSKF